RRPRVRVHSARRAWPEMEVNLLGNHQAANAALAVACVERLADLGWRLPDAAGSEGLASVGWPARLPGLGRRPLVGLDCAHNLASARALVETLTASFPEPPRRRLVFASSSDKDVAGILGELAPHFAHVHLTRYAQSTRAVPPERLAGLLPAGTPCSEHP